MDHGRDQTMGHCYRQAMDQNREVDHGQDLDQEAGAGQDQDQDLDLDQDLDQEVEHFRDQAMDRGRAAAAGQD